MTITNPKARDAYEREVEADSRVRMAVDEAFKSVRDALAGHGYKTAVDDLAENLVTDIFVYLAASNGWGYELTPKTKSCDSHDWKLNERINLMVCTKCGWGKKP